MIKTLNLTANAEKSISNLGGDRCRIQNRTAGTLYVSSSPNITPCADGVMSIPAGRGDYFSYSMTSDTVYLLSAAGGNVELSGEHYYRPFDNAAVTGGVAVGNPVVMDGLQGGVPFSEIVVSGKNLIGIAQAKALGGNENSGYNVIDSPYSRTIIQKLQPNTTYTVKKYDSGNRFRIVLFNNEPSTAADITAKQLVINTNGSITEYTFTTDTAYLWFAFTTHSAASGDAVEPIVQLEYGSTPTAYEPPIMGRELTIHACGKNLIKYPYANSTKTINGVTFTDNGDGTVMLSGTATANIIFWLGRFTIKAGKYTVSGFNSKYKDDRAYIGVRNGQGGVISNFYETSNSRGTVTISEDTEIQPIIYVNSGTTFNGDIAAPQLEIGTVATEYEPYHGAEYTITPDSNPYTVPDDIRQQDGLNVVTASEGELSVTGVRKNAAIKKIWDKLYELTTAVIVSTADLSE